MNKIIIGIAIRVFIIAAMICIKPIMEENESGSFKSKESDT
ncbi:MAG: hypothetical protein ACYDAJ_01765 [Nitrosotalea sp.]